MYYQSDYTYKGRVQTFTAPVDGWYRFTLYGADGGYGNNTYAHAGIGGKVGGTIWLKQGQGFYVYVGQTAPNTISHLWTWNGGAPSPRGNNNAHWGGAGGGATDIRLLKGSSDTDWSNMASLKSRIAVAGGGGGAGSTCSGGIYPNGTHFRAPDGGDAGGLIAETIYAYHTGTGNVNGITTGANQTSGGKGRGGLDVGDTSNVSDCQGSFGRGATGVTCCSGGGGGWYGGATCYTTGGSGGSSYLIGWTGCDTTYQAYQNNLASFELKFKDAVFEAGGTWNHAEKTWGDEGGAAFLELIERTYTNGVKPN